MSGWNMLGRQSNAQSLTPDPGRLGWYWYVLVHHAEPQEPEDDACREVGLPRVSRKSSLKPEPEVMSVIFYVPWGSLGPRAPVFHLFFGRKSDGSGLSTRISHHSTNQKQQRMEECHPHHSCQHLAVSIQNQNPCPWASCFIPNKVPKKGKV